MLERKVWLANGQIVVVTKEDADYLKADKWQTRIVKVKWQGIPAFQAITIFRSGIVAIEE